MFKLLVLILLVPSVFACIVPQNGMLLDKSAELCPGVYYLDKGIRISGEDVTLDCNGAVLKSWSGGNGIVIEHSNSIIVKACRLLNYNTGFYVKNSSRIFLLDNHLVKNNIGSRFVGISNSATLNHDVSLKVPFEILESTRNVISLTNKRVLGSFCQSNYCNQPRSAIEQFMLPPTSREDLKSWLGESVTGKSEKNLKKLVIDGLS